MTRKLQKFIPDTPKEFAYIGSSIGRLGAAMTGFGILQESLLWGLIALFFTWAGFEVNGYFKIHEKTEDDNKKAPE